jgi:lysophospholipase L1-like esterase
VSAGHTRAGTVRILALGDSYTIGEGVPAGGSWPLRLAALLRNEGVAVDHPKIIARTGWTTDELSAAVDGSRPDGPYDLVTLLVGVNNQYRGYSADVYRAEFRALLERAVAFAEGRPDRVIVLSIPDWSITPFAHGRDRDRIARELDEFNAINRAETAAASARYVDVTPTSREARDRLDLLAADGLHPSGAMYERWAQLVLPVAIAALDRGPTRHRVSGV